jgi:hypothetical protein
MNRRSLFTVLAGVAAVPAFAMAAGASPLALESLMLPAEMQRRMVVVRRPMRRAVVVRRPAVVVRRRAVVVRRPAVVVRGPRRVCVRRMGVLVCR